MKKLLIAMLCALLLVGCSNGGSQKETESVTAENNESLELTFNEAHELQIWLSNSISESMNGLNEVELFGTSNNDQEKEEHYNEVYLKHMEEVLEDCEYERGQKIIVSGFIGRCSEPLNRPDNGNGKIYCTLKNEAKGIDDTEDLPDMIFFRSDDEAFLEMEENTPVKIEGEFLSVDSLIAESTILYNCEIVE